MRISDWSSDVCSSDLVLILAVFGAAAGAIGAATFGWPEFAGSVLLALSIVAVTSFGTDIVETLFKYASMLIYAVYALFLVFALTSFGDRKSTRLNSSHQSASRMPASA